MTLHLAAVSQELQVSFEGLKESCLSKNSGATQDSNIFRVRVESALRLSNKRTEEWNGVCRYAVVELCLDE